MKIDFDSKIPLLEQRLRVAGAKQPGRKHQKRKGVKASERDKAGRKLHSSITAKKAKKFRAEVSAYWNGERDTYPLSP